MKKLGIVLLLLCFACDSEPVGPTGVADFGIYLSRDKTLSLYQNPGINIYDIALDNSAWIADDDIEMYDFSSHCIYLKKAKAFFFNQDLKITPNAQPFVVLANHRRCYTGCFYSLASSIAIAISTPFIDEIDIGYYPTDVLHISGGIMNGTDIRNDSNVEEGLKNAGLLHYGLSMSIKNIDILSNSDTAAVSYTYEIKNNDTDNLYILDPDKMGVNLFHYFTNGVVFEKNNQYYYAEYKTKEKPDSWDSWKPEWFSKINSGERIARTVVLKGYPHISPGNYECSIYFSSPHKIEKTDRILQDGRIWLGSILSTKFAITVE